MEVIQRWKRIKEGMGIELIAVGLGHEPNDRLSILDHMPVAINDSITFKSHNGILLVLYEHSLMAGCQEHGVVFWARATFTAFFLRSMGKVVTPCSSSVLLRTYMPYKRACYCIVAVMTNSVSLLLVCSLYPKICRV